MAGRNHITANGLTLRPEHHLHHLIEDRIAAQSRDIKTLFQDNQRLAATHAPLKQDVANADEEVRRLSAAAASVKADRDAQVRQVYERALKLEAEARSMDGLSSELDRVRADIKELRAERKEMKEKLKGIDDDLARNHLELQQLPNIKDEIELMRREILRGRAAVEYERKMSATNSEVGQAMETHMISMAHEAEKLRLELANAERAMAAAAAAAAVNPGPGYVTHHVNLEPGYVGNSFPNSYVVHQGTFDANSHYGVAPGAHGPPGPYDVQTQQVQS